jgi:hypothetical protein
MFSLMVPAGFDVFFQGTARMVHSIAWPVRPSHAFCCDTAQALINGISG